MKRSDGRLLRTISPFIKIIPYIMNRRSDAQIFAKQIIVLDKIDDYLRQKREDEHTKQLDINYLHIFIAIYVRVIAERPHLNRFVMNNQLYARKGIYISMAIKRSLKDKGEETTVKFAFNGEESIFEIARIVNQVIAENGRLNIPNDTDKIAERIMSLPGVIKKTMVGILKCMDKINILPRFIIEASPFHTTLFLSYLKSIKLDYVYHHLYDFGTAGLFAALGKVKKMPIVENNEVVIKNCCEIGYTIDERICDGLYFANSLKLVKKYLDNPILLETNLEKVIEDVQ